MWRGDGRKKVRGMIVEVILGCECSLVGMRRVMNACKCVQQGRVKKGGGVE